MHAAPAQPTAAEGGRHWDMVVIEVALE